MRIHTPGARRLPLFLLTLAAAATVAFLLPAMAHAAGNAAYTTVTAPGVCDNGSGAVNCNIYTDKADVYMSGGPSGGNGLADGCYYFAVLTPGSQHGGYVDGADGNLSDGITGSTAGDVGSGDTAADRAFRETGGLITYPDASCAVGTHVHGTGSQLSTGNDIVQLMTYDDTNNPGGVYILAVCEVGATSDSQCKFDAFKVRDTSCTANCGPGTVDNLTVGKSAFPTFTRTYAWDVAKSRTTAATVRLNSPGPATVSYRVTATWSGPVDSGWAVGGEITVTNGNVGDAYDLTVADAVNDANATCVVTGGESQTLAGKSQVVLPYTCTYSAAPAANAETNTATIEWNAILSDGSQTSGDAAHVDVDFTFNAATTGNPTVVNGCVTLTDTFNAVATTLGLACVNGTWTKDAGNALASFAESYTSPTFTLTYNRSIAVPANACAVYNNTAAITGLTDPTPLDDSASVTVCPRVNGLTIGFWSNKNGQARITGGAWTLVSGVNVCNVGTFLRSYAPFQALPANATCTAVAAYVYNVIKGGGTNCASTTCIAMLKAQMLATALNVFFLTTNGNELIDLVHGCKMIDSSGGTATCNGGESWSPAFDNQATKTVLQMLSWAASQYTDSTHWYGTSKPLQVLAKDAFDAINNGVALSA